MISLEIPLMTHPLSRSWDQPKTSDILIDEDFALMTQDTFDSLAEYSCSQPTGCYPGKMWKRHNGAFDPSCKPEDCRWVLAWYDFSDKGEMYCTTQCRTILIV